MISHAVWEELLQPKQCGRVDLGRDGEHVMVVVVVVVIVGDFAFGVGRAERRFYQHPFLRAGL